MFGLILQQSRRRSEDEHWWDRDPALRARNLRFEARLNSLIDPDDEPPRGGGDMPELIKAVLKFGVLPGMTVWLVFMGATEFRKDLSEHTKDNRRDMTIVLERMERSDRQQEQMVRQQEQIVRLLYAGCINAARNGSERGECNRAWNLK